MFSAHTHTQKQARASLTMNTHTHTKARTCAHTQPAYTPTHTQMKELMAPMGYKHSRVFPARALLEVILASGNRLFLKMDENITIGLNYKRNYNEIFMEKYHLLIRNTEKIGKPYEMTVSRQKI